MKRRIRLILALILGRRWSARRLPVISGFDTIAFSDTAIILTLSVTPDDINGFEGFIWVDYLNDFDLSLLGLTKMYLVRSSAAQSSCSVSAAWQSFRDADGGFIF